MKDDNSDKNTYMFDPESTPELARLINQDQMTTRAMGGPFAGLRTEVISGLRNVLDLACGPGGWVLDAAFTLPDCEVAGVDISRPMIDYAHARARSQGLHNASFEVMDVTRPLDLNKDTFDLVNARFLMGVLRQEAWLPLLTEGWRLLRPGGILRLTEPILSPITSSPTHGVMTQHFYQALRKRGYGFPPQQQEGYGITFMLPRLLRKAGYQRVTLASHVLEISDDTPAWANFYRDIEVGSLQAKPLLVQTGVVSPEEFDRLYQQMIIEWHTEGFTGMWYYQSVWGEKPS